MNRREFIKTSSLAAGGLIIAPGMRNFFSQDLQNSISSPWMSPCGYEHHLAMVFGDYVDDIRKLGKIMNYQVNAVV